MGSRRDAIRALSSAALAAATPCLGRHGPR